MKKIYCTLAIICVALMLAGPVKATTQTVSWDSTTKSITDPTGKGSGLTSIGLSPNVNIYYNSNTDGSKFELCGHNEKGKFEYGVTADDNNVYQHDMDDKDSGTITPTTTVAGDGATVTASPWILMGGTGTSGGS